MSKFHAFISRMKYIERWGLMRSTRRENIMEHTSEVCFIVHALCAVGKRYFGSDVDMEKAVMLALYHECGEVITGDLPTPIKYFNTEIKDAYKKLEKIAADKLLGMLPEELKGDFSPLLSPDTSSQEYRLVKAADKISACIKCIEEQKSGNTEFTAAYKTIMADLKKNPLPEVQYFLKNFLPPYSLTLDEI